MPIRPIDMITMAPKTQEATQYKHAENQKTIHEQIEFNTQFTNEINHNSKQTVKMTNENYSYDAKDKKGNQSNSNQKKKKKKQNEKNSSHETEVKTNRIDIRI